MRTSVPRRVNEIPYISRNVKKRIGGRLKTEDMERYAK